MNKVRDQHVMKNIAHHKKMELCRQLAWDYSISVDDTNALIRGEKESAGHYTQAEIFKKVLESYSWFTVLDLFTIDQIQELLTDDLIKSLRMPSLRKKYAFIKKR
jgi:hypothetical protein